MVRLGDGVSVRSYGCFCFRGICGSAATFIGVVLSFCCGYRYTFTSPDLPLNTTCPGGGRRNGPTAGAGRWSGSPGSSFS